MIFQDLHIEMIWPPSGQEIASLEIWCGDCAESAVHQDLLILSAIKGKIVHSDNFLLDNEMDLL